MSKDYIKSEIEKINKKISLSEFDELANKISNSIKSKENDIDNKKVKKIMAKYANAKDGKIKFDMENKSNMDYKELVENLTKSNKTTKSTKATNFFDGKLFDDKPIDKPIDKQVDKPIDKPVEKKIIKSFTKKTEKKNFDWSNALMSFVVSEKSNQNDVDDVDDVNDVNDVNDVGKLDEYNDNKKTYKLNYEYKKDFNYIPKIKLEPMSLQSVYDKQKDDKLDSEMKRRSKIVEKLLQLEFPAQKSEKWHALRKNRITASDGGCVLGDSHYEAPHKILHKKVINPPFKSNINCYNGNKYEQIATMIYSYRMNVDVEEFGLIAHPTCPFLAASPDGIISQYKLDKQHLTKYVGRMLEIKCPTTRQIKTSGEIKGEICPTHYWDQIQLQLECCDLDECDFWQCKISEYSSREEFIEDTDPSEPFRSKSSGFEKGIVIQLMPKRLPEENNHLIECFDQYKQLVKDLIASNDMENKKILIDKIKDNLNKLCFVVDEIKNKYNEICLKLENSLDQNKSTKSTTKSSIKSTQLLNLDELMAFDKYIDFVLKGKQIKCEHSKTDYCNNWKKKDPENCKYCESVYAYSKHIYPPKIDMTPYEYDEWIHEVMTNYSDQKLLDPALNVDDYYVDRIIYWKLDMSHCVTVYRDKEWYKQALPKIEKMWSYVEYFRSNPEKSKLFFEFVESLTIQSNFIKDKDDEMDESEINRILEVADLLSNGSELDLNDEIKQNIVNKTKKNSNKFSKYKKS